MKTKNKAITRPVSWLIWACLCDNYYNFILMEEEILSLKFMKRSVSVEYLIFAILFECNFKWKRLKTKVSYSAGRRDSQRKWFTVSRGLVEVRKAESISLPLPPVQALFPWIAAWGESFQKFLATDPSRLRTRDPFRCGVHQEDYRAPANVWGSCLSDYLAACLCFTTLVIGLLRSQFVPEDLKMRSVSCP